MRRALRDLRYVERERLGALVMLALAAVIVACGALLGLLWGGQAAYLIAGAVSILGGLLLAVVATGVILDARRRERQAMDRIVQ